MIIRYQLFGVNILKRVKSVKLCCAYLVYHKPTNRTTWCQVMCQVNLSETK